jgi:hypothetical protein
MRINFLFLAAFVLSMNTAIVDDAADEVWKLDESFWQYVKAMVEGKETKRWGRMG